jgi:CBS domain containing-hemolysin-like protein
MGSLAVTVLSVLAIVVLLVLSAFFSSSEIALFTLPDDGPGVQGATLTAEQTALDALRADPHRLLVTILVGNNVINVAIASVTTALILDVLPTGGAVSVTVSTLLASFVVLVFGEIVPKSYGLSHARDWSLRVARPLRVAEWVLTPLVVCFEAITGVINGWIGGEPDIERSYLDDPDFS